VFENQELANWLEACLKEIFQQEESRKIDSACVVARCADGYVVTGYYRADVQDKAIFAHNIHADAMLDVVLNNIDRVREALEEDADDDER
jgi:hypothetical protein